MKLKNLNKELKEKIEVAKSNILTVTAWLVAAQAEETEILNKLIKENIFFDTDGNIIEDIENIYEMDDLSWIEYKEKTAKTNLKNARGKILRYERKVKLKEDILIDLVLPLANEHLETKLNITTVKKNLNYRATIIELSMKWDLDS